MLMAQECSLLSIFSNVSFHFNMTVPHSSSAWRLGQVHVRLPLGQFLLHHFGAAHFSVSAINISSFTVQCSFVCGSTFSLCFVHGSAFSLLSAAFHLPVRSFASGFAFCSPARSLANILFANILLSNLFNSTSTRPSLHLISAQPRPRLPSTRPHPRLPSARPSPRSIGFHSARSSIALRLTNLRFAIF